MVDALIGAGSSEPTRQTTSRAAQPGDPVVLGEEHRVVGEEHSPVGEEHSPVGDEHSPVRGIERDGLPVVTVEGPLLDQVVQRILPLIDVALRVRRRVAVEFSAATAQAVAIGELLGRIADLPAHPRTMVCSGDVEVEPDPDDADGDDASPVVIVRILD